MTTAALIVAGLAFLAVGAEALVRGSSSLALRLGVTPLVVGLTIVAFGTSAPELFVSIVAARAGNGGIALGNVVGSNIGNIGLILGAAAISRPMRVRSELVKREMPVMIAVTLLFLALLADGGLSRVDGGLLLAGAVVYTTFAAISARRDKSRTVATEFGEALATTRDAWLDVALIVAGFAGLLIGARWLLAGAVAEATALGISQAVIGLTIVAIGTSLPELATSVIAAIRNEPDVALGNVIGSNILNILFILGVAALIRPIDMTGLRVTDLAVMLGFALFALPLMRRGFVLTRWEGALLVAGYFVYLYTLLP